MKAEEIWKDIPEWEGLYQVSNLGNVRSVTAERIVNYKGRLITRKVIGRVLIPFIAIHNYRTVSLHCTFRKQKTKISRLVLSAFVSVQPSTIDACHNDGDSMNDKLSNLRWDSRKGNMKDCKIHGTHVAGADSKNSTLSLADIIDIREMIQEKVSYSLIAKKYGVCKQTICNIKKGKSYTGLDETELVTEEFNEKYCVPINS